MLPMRQKSSSAESTEDRGLSIALNFIKYRPRSAFEVVRRLQRAGLDANRINSIVIQLTEFDILNDSRFARDWVRSRDRLHPVGNYLLKRELSEKGIVEDVIGRVLNERETEEWFAEIGVSFDGRRLETVLAEQLVKQRWPKIAKVDNLKQKQKLSQFLARRGFSPDAITATVFRNRCFEN